jgi:hypothetical protein
MDNLERAGTRSKLPGKMGMPSRRKSCGWVVGVLIIGSRVCGRICAGVR